MPFGAEVSVDSVAFRIWAPSVERVELALGDRLLEMAPDRAGWWRLAVAGAGHGDRYGFRIDGGLTVPDPASRFLPDDVHGRSEVIDPTRFAWAESEAAWQGRPWVEAVIYELHLGCFTDQGTFAAATSRLEHLVDLGVTAVELMPIAAFPGRWGWGYDGVQPFAPDARYGRPGALKALVQRAHQLGLMVLLDVVYNHLGPEGNYLHLYAKPMFTDRYQTPWGAAINLDGDQREAPRELLIENALYWLEEYGLDGLRLDAVHAIFDRSDPHLLTELAERVARLAARAGRQIHLVLENDANQAGYLERGDDAQAPHYAAQWNDDLHHALHVLLTGEDQGYYADYADRPLEHLGRCLAEGFAYQGERSRFRDGARRGEPSAHLPPGCFVGFLQNHDQVGNRAFGERIDRLAPAARVEAALAVLLLSPSPPLLFMGQEWASAAPFLFFCDFGPDLADAVRDGRRAELAGFAARGAREQVPDCCAAETHRASVLDWDAATAPVGARRLALHRRLLKIRREQLVPLLSRLRLGAARATVHGGALEVSWPLDDGRALLLLANLQDHPLDPGRSSARMRSALASSEHRLLFVPAELPRPGALPPWSVCWLLAPWLTGAGAEMPEESLDG